MISKKYCFCVSSESAPPVQQQMLLQRSLCPELFAELVKTTAFFFFFFFFSFFLVVVLANERVAFAHASLSQPSAMKILVLVALFFVLAHAQVFQQCTTITNCNTCGDAIDPSGDACRWCDGRCQRLGLGCSTPASPCPSGGGGGSSGGLSDGAIAGVVVAVVLCVCCCCCCCAVGVAAVLVVITVVKKRSGAQS